VHLFAAEEQTHVGSAAGPLQLKIRWSTSVVVGLGSDQHIK
jgi:hypothetical protein